MREYEVEINGAKVTMQLSDEEAKRRGLEPAKTKKAPAPKNKARRPRNKASS